MGSLKNMGFLTNIWGYLTKIGKYSIEILGYIKNRGRLTKILAYLTSIRGYFSKIWAI